MKTSRDATWPQHVPGAKFSGDPDIDSIEKFARASCRLIGKTATERTQWNTEATADAIRHFAWGISDDNPLWVDRRYAESGPYGRLAAPPTFLFSILYPFLHGEPSVVPLTFLISDITCRWYLPILEGDRLTAISAYKDVIQAQDREGRETVYIVAESTYRNQSNEVVGVIEGTLAAIERSKTEMMIDREIHEYSEEDINVLCAALRAERRTGSTPAARAIQPGEELPPISRGPLTVGDLISWQAAIGPSYRSGALAYRDLLANPHTATVLPRVGWPVRYSQQHEDFMLTKQRGMPAPFDNSTMRTAWLSVLLTNWMGDDGFLRRMQVSTIRPVIYGDTNRYTGKVIRKSNTGEEVSVTIRLNGTNQLGEVTTTGEAEVSIPSRTRETKRKTYLVKRNAMLDWGPRGSCAGPVTVCDLFAKQVQVRPHATAVKIGKQALTYAELDTQANQLSHALALRGIRPGKRLGLYLGRTIDMAIGILACAKAGAAYVPLDPSYPTKRLIDMLEESEINVVLTDGRQFETRTSGNFEILQLETLKAGQLDLNVNGPATKPVLEDPAYLLFTSGSTGHSKAVTVSHAVLSMYLRSLLDTLEVTASDVCLHTASFSFSAAVRQFWLPLCTGAKLVITDEEAYHRPLLLFELMHREGATVWDTVPSILEFAIESLLELEARQRTELLNNQLSQIFTTGEPLLWGTVRAWRELRSNCRSIINLYSQTETAGTVCFYPVPDVDETQEGIVPVGRPLSNTGVCLLDDELRPVADGEAGEICVAGERLANGYVAHPETSVERFVRINLADGTQERVFRTGDLGCRNADGILECLGRTDDQIKIRGFRILLSEVEAALRRSPNIENCVVVSSVDAEPRVAVQLNAYIVPHAGRQLDASELRAQLANWLPEHMLPQTITFLDELPHNPNGKLDRSSLPQPKSKVLGSPSSAITPRNKAEELLATIWRNFLNIDEVGVFDNFFELGGHSLLATRVITHVSKETGIELPLMDFFDKPTIADLAALLQNIEPDSKKE